MEWDAWFLRRGKTLGHHARNEIDGDSLLAAVRPSRISRLTFGRPDYSNGLEQSRDDPPPRRSRSESNRYFLSSTYRHMRFPGFAVTSHCVEYSQKLVHTGNDGDFAGFASGFEVMV